jgi:hypothetical protein
LDLKLIKIIDLNEKEKDKVDEFIFDELSNGEFINSIRYLSYHPGGRFIDDSIIIKDLSSGVIKSVVMAGCKPNDMNCIISHPGTTFSGPIFKTTQGIEEINKVLALILEYYESKYKKIEFRTQPTIYSSQPIEDIPYLLVKNGYSFGYTALANVIDLSKIKNDEDIFKIYDSKRRNQIRKSIRDFKYQFIEEDFIDEYVWGNMNDNLDKKFEASTTHSFAEITNLREKFPKEIVPYKTQNIDGQYGAFALIYKFKNVFHTQYLDLNYNLRHEYPNLLLIHNLIKLAIDEGFRFFSFGASTENGGEIINEGLYNYKKGFGGGRLVQPMYKKEVR